ncbi:MULTISPECIES: bifunctional diguanylate cyclase/phosphodiesterase [unclassified Fusibacter]|uniref:putative bifunctional diguanylate cyclase/phosphodiesterase n=1 Tax=unclassified Fusibacter TaxID=2624464 RepID=UPI0013E902DB|nr:MULTISPECIES: bifunctional diguanylate cyclase/phosphodiesterase [unclassified Fusibacter]MCK8060400.1 bifunctional diguanylate cyclase/phosphodiesterase [Fusibacter sp. A2]NPE20311.1 bifunctional diguanylate cyclase/phosphodiesterase [Fusibacter sp. A1]
MPFAWAIADTLWLYYEHFTSIDPNESTLLLYIYALPNIFMVFAIIDYFYKNITKWHRMQLLLDMGLVFIILLGLASSMLLKNIDLTILSNVDFISLVIYMVTDVCTGVVILAMLFSSRMKKIPIELLLGALAFLIYIVSDQIFIFSYYYDTYIANSISDVMFLASFTLFVIVGIIDYQNNKPTADTLFRAPENIGKTKAVWVISMVPIAAFLLKVIDLHYLAIMFLAIVLNLAFSHYVQKSYLVETLLKRETLQKATLEETVDLKTRELVALNNKLFERSTTDYLTGLYNRSYFLEYLKGLIEENKTAFSVFFMDLDRFKVINDLHGHSMGDAVLKEVAKRLSKLSEGEFMISRFGGDEFAVALTADSNAILEDVSQRMIGCLSQGIVIDKYIFNVDVSIGIARYPKDALTSEELMKFADIAMYHAKASDSNENYVFYTSQLIERIERRNHLELLLRNAAINNDFELYYQPQFNAKTKVLTGMEALIRWYHPVEGFISPAEFIPIAEEAGLIVDISEWVSRTACLQIKNWNEKYGMELTIAINTSPICLDGVDFFKDIKELMATTGVKPSWIDIEITEHSAMNSSTRMEEIFMGLSDMGVNISIDDFGTGYSSLSYIKRFDVDTLKIAKELIDNIATDKDDLLIVNAIVMVAKGMGLKTIAEGVETEMQLKLLQELDCHTIQGYLLGKPVDGEKFEKIYLESKDGCKGAVS